MSNLKTTHTVSMNDAMVKQVLAEYLGLQEKKITLYVRNGQRDEFEGITIQYETQLKPKGFADARESQMQGQFES